MNYVVNYISVKENELISIRKNNDYRFHSLAKPQYRARTHPLNTTVQNNYFLNMLPPCHDAKPTCAIANFPIFIWTSKTRMRPSQVALFVVFINIGKSQRQDQTFFNCPRRSAVSGSCRPFFMACRMKASNTPKNKPASVATITMIARLGLDLRSGAVATSTC